MSRISLEEVAKTVEQIPTLPIVSRQIMNLLEDEDVAFKDIADLIEKDQALAVKILKVANSAFYGAMTQVSSIDNALVKLGLGEVKSILHAFSVMNFFPAPQDESFDRLQFWRHSIICSHVAKYLGQYFKVVNDDTLFLSGLIHDMGKIVFDQYFHDEFLQIVERVLTKKETFSKAEKTLVGFTHYQVSAKLLQQWKFPKKVIMQVFYHHAPWNDSTYNTGSTIIYLANILTKLSGFPSLSSETVMDIETFAASKAFDYIVKSGFDIDRQRLATLVQHIQDFVGMESENILRLLEN